MRRTKILITGGAGFIGSNLIKKLDKNRWDIIVIDSLIQQVHASRAWDIPEGVTFYHKDIRDKKALSAALNQVGYIVHLSAETGVGQSAYEISRYVDTNEHGTAILLETALKHQSSLKGVILASSRAVYGEGRYFCSNCGDIFPGSRDKENLKAGIWDHPCPECGDSLQNKPCTEDQPLSPASCYSITKYNQEQLFSFLSYTFNVPTVVLRFQNVYGPGQSLTNPYTGILSIFHTRIASGNPVHIYEDGKESRDFVYIDDAVQSICMSLEKTPPGFNVFNVGTGINTSVFEVATMLSELMNAKSKVEIVGKFRVGDIRHACADLGEIKSAFGYQPKVDLNQGLKNFVEWANMQPLRSDNYVKMEKEMEDKGLMGKAP